MIFFYAFGVVEQRFRRLYDVNGFDPDVPEADPYPTATNWQDWIVKKIRGNGFVVTEAAECKNDLCIDYPVPSTSGNAAAPALTRFADIGFASVADVARLAATRGQPQLCQTEHPWEPIKNYLGYVLLHPHYPVDDYYHERHLAWRLLGTVIEQSCIGRHISFLDDWFHDPWEPRIRPLDDLLYDTPSFFPHGDPVFDPPFYRAIGDQIVPMLRRLGIANSVETWRGGHMRDDDNPIQLSYPWQDFDWKVVRDLGGRAIKDPRRLLETQSITMWWPKSDDFSFDYL
jgi:hypothetical protein